MATCVMTVSVSTLLTGRYGRNCLYFNCLDNKSLAKMSFRKVVLADTCSGCCLAMPSISVTYCKCVPNHACQEGRKLGLSLIGFRKFICACPLAPDGNTDGITTTRFLYVTMIFRCPRPVATCVMTVPVSTLLTGRYGRN